MKEELEKLVVAGKIGRQHVEPLVHLENNGYCMHRSWGFGKIVNLDFVQSRCTIDFVGKPGHSLDLGFAAESLKPIAATHILARKAADLPGLQTMAALNHLDLIKLVLESYGGKASLEQIQQVLVPDVIKDDWRKWWENARRELKKDGHFVVPIKKSDLIVYQPKVISLQTRILSDFRSAKGLKARLVQTAELIKSYADLDDAKTAAVEAIATLNGEIATHQRTYPGLALEAVFMRDELRVMAGVEPQAGEVTEAAIWAQNIPLDQVLEPIPAAKYKSALTSFKTATPDAWSEALLGAMNTFSTKLCGEAAALLMQEDQLDELKSMLERLISQHKASTELLLWLAKERSDKFADILGPEVFRAMLSAIERDQASEKKSNKLRDYILDDQKLLVELIASADMEVIKDLTRTLQLSPSFDDMDKRSLLARIVRNFPAIQALISGDHVKQDSTLIVSWKSLERRRIEYDELVHKKIPANSKEIAIARSYGDLRENHEYKAAKEMQKLLMRRKGELEGELNRARGTDFATVSTDTVNVGTKVKVTDPVTRNAESYCIMGAWDTDVERGIISYLSPMAQSLLNHKVGDQVEFELEGVKKKLRLEIIESLPKLPEFDPLPPQAPEAQQAQA
jgi:transcription elongation GreA/GreB family factor